MGALQSILEANLTDVEEAKTFDTSSSTPSRPINKRLLSLDPRSPSENIQRTPIIVEKTPLPTPSTLVNSQETPVLAASTNDPRSPTTEFTRTPINPCLAAERRTSRLPTLDNRPSTVTLGSESGIESAEVTPVRDALPTPRVESPDSAFSADDVQVELLAASNTFVDSTPSPISSSSSSSASERTPLIFASTNYEELENTPKLPALRSRPLNSNKLSRVIAEGDKISGSPQVPRSPLTNVANARTGLCLQQNKTRLSDSEDQPLARSGLAAGVNKENVCS